TAARARRGPCPRLLDRLPWRWSRHSVSRRPDGRRRRTMSSTTTPVALVTGANKGIGLATARLLAERGMTVLVGSRDIERGVHAATALVRDGLDARHVQIDIADDASVSAAAWQIEAEHGRLD